MKKNYLDEKKKRLKQKIKVLVNRPAFQKDIADLRIKWNIPSEGLKTEEENQEWNNNFYIATDTYFEENWPKERNKIIELRKEKKFKEAEEIRKKINAEAPINALREDIWSIVRKYRLSSRWHKGINRYLSYNDADNMGIEVGVTVLMNWDNGIQRVSLEIDHDTTLNDLKHVWSWARKMYKGRQTDKYQPIPNFDRDKRAYELEQEGKSWKDIADIIEDEFGDTLDYNELNIAIKRYKKRLNINQA